MTQKNLLVSCDVPGWGGASTRSYLIFERLQRDGHAVAFLNLVRAAQEVDLRARFGVAFGNPRGLAQVNTCILNEPLWGQQDGLTKLLDTLAPQRLFSFGYVATNLLHRAAPDLETVFATIGCQRVRYLIETGAVSDFMGYEARIAPRIRVRQRFSEKVGYVR